MASDGSETEEMEAGKKRDIRSYKCEFCGVVRSKKALIRAHMLEHHQDEVSDLESHEVDGDNAKSKEADRVCKECGASFRKPAHLKQHMQSHSFERPFACPVDGCPSSYRRQDHLNRHLFSHRGKIFTCPIEGCGIKFVIKANMQRHVIDMHEGGSSLKRKKEFVCEEANCGKTFKYASKLKKHQESHFKLDYTEVVCCHPGCMKTFSNLECLKAHNQCSHQHIKCGVCGTKQLKKNIKRHMRSHGKSSDNERVTCCMEGCTHSYSKQSNLKKHLQASHEKLRPFACRFSGCGKKFAHKHVIDRHEDSGAHVYLEGDFEEADEEWRSRPRGGRKRKGVSVETLTRKRVAPSAETTTEDDGPEYLKWLLSV